MNFIDKLKAIDKLKTAIENIGCLPSALLNKINYKLRLEWNYTSNSIEGNTLTKKETRTVMVGLIDVHNKPIKDIMEIRNHDKVVSAIMKMGKGELNISERRIKDIHKGIMYEEDPKKLSQIGEWKHTDNFIYNSQGERYDFVSHTDVALHMHSLVNWVNAEKDKISGKKKDAIHPVLIALNFHADYLAIHPFYDGNGRTARILTNLILIAYGYPPLYVKVEEKNYYHQYLTDMQSYGGGPELFYEFMAGLLLRSLTVVKAAIDGSPFLEDDL